MRSHKNYLNNWIKKLSSSPNEENANQLCSDESISSIDLEPSQANSLSITNSNDPSETLVRESALTQSQIPIYSSQTSIERLPADLHLPSSLESSSLPIEYTHVGDTLHSEYQHAELTPVKSNSSSAVISVQSSVFSQGCPSGAQSTVPSSQYSAKGHFEANNEWTGLAGNPVTFMKLAEPTSYSPANEFSEKTPGGKHNLRHPTPTRQCNITGLNSMPEVPIQGTSHSTLARHAHSSQSTSCRFTSHASSFRGSPLGHSAGDRVNPSTLVTNPFFNKHPSSTSTNLIHTPSSSSLQSSNNTVPTVSGELKILAEALLALFDHANKKIAELVFLAECVNNNFSNILTFLSQQPVEPGTISMHSDPALLTIIKVVLHFADNLLVSSQFHQQRAMLLHKLYSLGVKLKLLQGTISGSMHLPKNFAVGSIPELPCEQHVMQILEVAANHSSEYTSDQTGAFIAPILRGFAPEFSVMSLIFGYPVLRPEHFEQVSSLYEFRPDVHFLCQENYIRACSRNTFKAPFRVPSDPLAPPISMSLSKQNNPSLSGTLGGYIYPQIDPTTEPMGCQFSKSTFAVTCGHVCLDTGDNNGAEITVPSSYLSALYRDALSTECDKYSPGTIEHRTYACAMNEIPKYFQGNSSTFGQVVWGERTVIGKHLSDVAIIKCNENLKCKNYLGDDISFSEYDPALMFGNLYVKNVVQKPTPGMQVFKYGSTTKYTSGQLNGHRMVYWADGRLQSSEFVVSSDSPAFASGGDSGAWILHKNVTSQDYFESSSTSQYDNIGPSLGVVGMLHSYDGERKEFGLYTPMSRILDRLEEVTSVKWGVVGIADNESLPAGGSDSSEDDIEISSEGE